jgi:flagellar hook-basal body complex protein FliE
MNEIGAIAALGLDGAPQLNQLGLPGMQAVQQPGGESFESVLSAGLKSVDQKIAHADSLVQQFALDDSIPVHQVTIALEEARLSVELAMQVRARLVETYREFMNMQL